MKFMEMDLDEILKQSESKFPNDSVMLTEQVDELKQKPQKWRK